MNKHLKALIAIFFVLNLTAIGVCLFINTRLGSDTLTVLDDGVQRTLHVSLGSAALIYNTTALIIALLINSKALGWTTIANALLVGFVIDIYNPLFQSMNIHDQAMIIRLIAIFIGQVCIAIAFSLLIKFGSGINQADAIAYGIEQRTKIPYKYVRTILDVIFLLSGWLMGGVVGVGSVFAMCTTGIFVDTLLKIYNKFNIA